MDKKKLTVALLTTFAATSLLAGCGKEKEVTVSKVKLSEIYYTDEDTLEWEKMNIVVQYSDSTSTTISASEIEFDVETPVKETTKALVKTDGLYGVEKPETRTYNLKVSLKADWSVYYDLAKISMGKLSADNFVLKYFDAPSFVTKFKTANENAEKALPATPTQADLDAAEGQFKKKVDYTVGTMNTFKFIPVAVFSQKNDDSLVYTNNYDKKVIVKEIVGNEEKDIVSPETVYELVNNGINFKDTAAGRKFKISYAPRDFDKMLGGSAIKPVEFTFEVKKGLNIYNAKQLGVLNLTSIAASDNVGKEFQWIGRYGDDGAGGIDDNSVGDFFYDSVSDSYKSKDMVPVWKQFLKDTGTFTDEEITKYTDIPGVFLQDDISINGTIDELNSSRDIPNDYFIAENEKVNIEAGKTGTGALRDDSKIYVVPQNVEREINGNLFNLDTSRIPLCKTGEKDGKFHIWNDQDATIFPGHAALFYMSGLEPKQDYSTYFSNKVLNSAVKPAVIKNINTKGNTTADITKAKDDFEKKLKVTGLIFTKANYAPIQMNNMIVKEYMIGAFANRMWDKLNDGSYPMQVNDSRIYDCSNSGLFNYACQGFGISNTELKRFGGAAIINTGYKGDMPAYAAATYVKSDCVCENYVTGEEVYFAAIGASTALDILKPYNQAFAAVGKPFSNAEDGMMNVLSLSLEDGYLNSSVRLHNSKTVFNYDTSDRVGFSLTENHPAPIVYDILGQNLPQYTIVGQTVGEKLFDATSGSVDSTNPVFMLTEVSDMELALLLTKDPSNVNTMKGLIAMATGQQIDVEGTMKLPAGLYAFSSLASMDPATAFASIRKVTELKGSVLSLLAPVEDTTLNVMFGL